MSPDLQRELVLVAGPNGSGKSTLAEDYIRQRFPVWPNINADLVAKVLTAIETSGTTATSSPLPERSREAASLIDQTARCLSLLSQPFVLETVLSTDKYRPLVVTARRLQLIFRLIYITTRDPAINVSRVQQRVQAGGHDVPVASIHARWHRSMDNLSWFAARADRMLVVDNSGAGASILALRKLGGVIELRDRTHPVSERLRALVGQAVEPP